MLEIGQQKGKKGIASSWEKCVEHRWPPLGSGLRNSDKTKKRKERNRVK